MGGLVGTPLTGGATQHKKPKQTQLKSTPPNQGPGPSSATGRGGVSCPAPSPPSEMVIVLVVLDFPLEPQAGKILEDDVVVLAIAEGWDGCGVKEGGCSLAPPHPTSLHEAAPHVWDPQGTLGVGTGPCPNLGPHPPAALGIHPSYPPFIGADTDKATLVPPHRPLPNTGVQPGGLPGR